MKTSMRTTLTPIIQTKVSPKIKMSQRRISLPWAVVIGTLPTLMLILMKVYG